MALRTRGWTILSIIVVTTLCLGAAAAGQEKAAAQEPFEQGVAALAQGNPTLAAEKFTAALKIDPEMLEAYINRGIAEMKLDQWADAVGDFDQALELAPNSPEAYYNRGLAYSRQGLPDKALADYTQALKFAPKDWQIYYNRGNAYLDMNKAPGGSERLRYGLEAPLPGAGDPVQPEPGLSGPGETGSGPGRRQ